MSLNTPLFGKCHCGKIEFKLESVVGEPVHCHCVDCRKTSGAPLVSWITVPKSSFIITSGDPKSYLSSKNGLRTFCGDCGAQISFEHDNHHKKIDITVGLLEKCIEMKIEKEIFTDSKLSSIQLGGMKESLPKM